MGCGTRVIEQVPAAARAGRASMLVDDQARREAGEALGAHMASGRLTFTEYEARLDAAFAARTQVELSAVLADLPRVATASTTRRRRAAARSMVGGWVALCALFLAIWMLTGAGYFWPIWPIMGTAIGTIPGAWGLWHGTSDPSGAA